MAFTIYKSDGTQINIPDGTIDQTYSANLVGNNASSYGEPMAETTIRQLENFSNNTPPAGAIKGQLWFDTGSSAIRVWIGTDPGQGDNSETDLSLWDQVGGKVESVLLPAEDGIDIGAGEKRFRTGYFENLDIKNGPITIQTATGAEDAILANGNIGVNGTIYPLDPTANDVIDSLGTAAARWDLAFIDTLDVSSRIEFTPTVGLQLGTESINPTTSGIDLGESISSRRFGTIYADTFDGSVTNAEQADKLRYPRTIALTGDVTGSVVFDGSANVAMETTVQEADNYYTKDQIDQIILATIAQTQNASWPVGSIYENRTNGDNPSTILGFGTWISLGSGRVTVGSDSSDTDFDTAGNEGGAKTVALSVANMAAHTHTGPNHRHTGPNHSHSGPNHSHTISHTHTRGTQEISGSISASGGSSYGAVAGASGAFRPSGTARGYLVGANTSYNLHPSADFYASRSWTGSTSGPSSSSSGAGGTGQTGSGGTGNTSYNGTGNTGSTGSGEAHNNLQPYVVVYRWYRTG